MSAATRPPCTTSARPRRRLVGVVAAALALTTFSQFGHRAVAGSSPPSGPGGALTSAGRELAATIDWTTRPNYRVFAALDPASGAVSGRVDAELPVGRETDVAHLRWFPAVAAADAAVEDVVVGGATVAATVDRSLLTVPLGGDHGDTVELSVRFRFVAPAFTPTSLDLSNMGSGLQPADIGLLARGPGSLVLGHWFPIWIPPGRSTEPELDGYGDIANFPAATISALLDVPAGNTVVTSGVRIDESAPQSGHDVVHEGGTGLRDFAVVVFAEADQLDVVAGDTAIVVTAPSGTADAEVVGDIAAESVTALGAAFGPYPWTELDVVAVPLGSSVGGMEWPGMVWIESTIFQGGVPGLGDLGDLGDVTEVFEDNPELGDLLGVGDIGLQLSTMREWTVAHEVGHMWWHTLVGNDSITEPVIDEPLAQHAACLVERDRRPADAEAVCDANTRAQFEASAGLLGVADAAADQPSDAFESSMQYGAVVYGKAPLFYRALEDEFGVAETTAALASVVRQHAFGQLTADELRSGLGVALGDPSLVDELWSRWMEQANGVADPLS